MEICATCATKLDPSWKFCVKCGTPVPAGAAHQSRDEHYVDEAAVPAAAPATMADPVAPSAPAKSPAATSAPTAVRTAARTAVTAEVATPAKSTRKPRRAKSRFEPKTTAIPIVTIPVEPVADIPEPESAASVGYVLTPESALNEPALPESYLQGAEQSVSSQSRRANPDVSRLGQARAEYARAEREAEALAVAEQAAAERAREASEASERARAEREAAERALAESEATERALAELAAAEQARAERDAVEQEAVDRARAEALVALSEQAQAAQAESAPDESTPGESAFAELGFSEPSTTLLVTNENPFAHNLPPRPMQPQSRAEAKAAAAERAVTRARNTAAAKAEIRAKYPIPSASTSVAAQEYTDETPAAFRTADGPHAKRKLDVPLVVSISLATAGVILIVYLAILVFGARG
jgi:hypothetical protein